MNIQVAFLDADSSQPDPAQTSATARDAVRSLRADGYEVTPAYDGTLGGELFEIVRALADGAAANKNVVLALIAGVAAPIAGALAARLKEKPTATPAVTVSVAGVSAAAEPGISDGELLRRLLAADPQLAQRVTPDAAVRIEVRVAPR